MTLLIPHNKHVGLLSEAESACFDVARRYHRRRLVADLVDVKAMLWPRNLKRLSWSDDGMRFLVQCLVLVVYLPFNFLYQLLVTLQNLLLFPFKYLASWFTPQALHAPGEKNLVGLYNAFFPFLSLSPDDAVACIDEWVPILYGSAKARAHRLARYVDDERIKQMKVAKQSGVMAASFRSYRAIARERLSKDLGHYSGNRQDR
ncbi:hypothetical protein L1F30_09340 [Simiduia sp. 21SJ11W-1]|uniref:hypothetical protein n=1 Tax=Simiduia sp. 21SJ11W-1 TaxID=2909669 RepID=UPI00209EB1DA|nr:hypothetical protein [Simiduia sp. 21SJ11W-1]UTA46378.1 hypothetical protein L1F30_09340 [Simiduia sp. 21SJ11W-1]